MYRIRSIDLHPQALANCIDLGRVLAVAVKIGLALVFTLSLVFGVAVRAGIAPDFDQRIALDAQPDAAPGPRITHTARPARIHGESGACWCARQAALRADDCDVACPAA
jgi:hypothetical protein